uniref:Uncharacterized protein n=1 Tax=Oryza punctata TaxID=4537 RepID=A0A0E0L2L2_ORYPU
MEGLIPLLYKAIKDRRSGRAAYPDGGAAGVDLYDPEQRRLWLQQEPQQQQHRRNLSLEELAGEVGLSPDRRLRRVALPLPKARSVRVFSCIGAGAGAAA